MALAAFDSICGTGPAYFKDVCVLMSDISGCSNFFQLNVAIRDEQEPCSADRVFELQRHSSGTVFLRTCTLQPSVVHSSELGWKIIISTRLTQRTDLWEISFL